MKTNEQNQPQTPHTGASKGGQHQESRDHNKHNNSGQGDHKPQKHSPAQEKK
jgi:hypothetical protein